MSWKGGGSVWCERFFLILIQTLGGYYTYYEQVLAMLFICKNVLLLCPVDFTDSL